MTNRTTTLIVAALLVAACGGESTSTTTLADTAATTTTTTQATTTTTEATTTTQATVPGESAQLTAVKAALSQSAGVTSGRVEGSIKIIGADDGSGGTADYELPFSSAFDQDSGNSQFSIDMSSVASLGGSSIPPEAAGMFGSMEVRVVDGTSYIKFPFFAMMFGATTPWISAPATEGEDLASSFTFSMPTDPANVFSEYQDAGAEVTDLGRETVNGVETTHYQAVFDTAAMIANASPDELAKLEANGPLPQTVLPMDLWITDGGQVVRYSMTIDGTDLAGTDATAGDTSGFQQMVMTFDLLDMGQPVDITAPDPSEVTDVSQLTPGMSIPTP